MYKGVLADGPEVAVKRLFFSRRQWAEQLFKEAKLVSQVKHKNLVKLLGCSVDGPESLLARLRVPLQHQPRPLSLWYCIYYL